jgi:TM2 domain-containing membrane protein YozV
MTGAYSVYGGPRAAHGTVGRVTQPEPAPEPDPATPPSGRPALRIGNAEREEAANALAEHFAHGRLDGDEYEDRVGLVWNGKTTADLSAVFDDLPEPRPAVLRPPPPPPDLTMAYGPPAGLPAPFVGGTTYGAPGLPRPVPAVHPSMQPAPFGREPATGLPYSDKSKVTAGILQLFLGGVGAGRFYTGHTEIAIAQLIVTIVTFGLGAIWGVADGIVLLAGRNTDPQGRPLRP